MKKKVPQAEGMNTFRFGIGGPKLDPKRRVAAMQTIQSQSVMSWGETEVGVILLISYICRK